MPIIVYRFDLVEPVLSILMRPELSQKPEALSRGLEDLRGSITESEVFRATVREEDVSLSFEPRPRSCGEMRIEMVTKRQVFPAFTHTSPDAARLLKKLLRGKIVHDLGSGNLAMAHYLLRTQPKRICCYDKLYRDSSHVVFKGDARLHLKLSVEAERYRGAFAELNPDTDILFIGFPWTASAGDPMAQVLTDAPCNAVLAMQNDSTFACGTTTLLLSCLSRNVKPSGQVIGRYTSYATYLSSCHTSSAEWTPRALEFALEERQAKVVGTGLLKLLEFMLSFRTWRYLTFTEYCFLVYFLPSEPTFAFLKMPLLKVLPEGDRESYYTNTAAPPFVQVLEGYRTYLGEASSDLGERLNQSFSSQIESFQNRRD